MHQNLKNHKEKAFLLFQKVYIYRTNNKKPWDQLTFAEREDIKFKWDVIKFFIISNGEITKQDIWDHLEFCPESFEYVSGTNAPIDIWRNDKTWNVKSIWFDIYPPFPLTEYDAKLLMNTIGLRMCHFINTKRTTQ